MKTLLLLLLFPLFSFAQPKLIASAGQVKIYQSDSLYTFDFYDNQYLYIRHSRLAFVRGRENYNNIIDEIINLKNGETKEVDFDGETALLSWIGSRIAVMFYKDRAYFMINPKQAKRLSL